MRKLIVVLTVALVLTAVGSWKFARANDENTTVEGKVTGQSLTSKRFPSVTFEFPAEFKYAGSQRFALYSVADAEQHFWVEADDMKNVKRLFWVQYEGYYPTNTHTYDYSDQPIRFSHGGLEWLADVALSKPMGMPSSNPPNPNSDGSRFRALMKAKGFKLPAQHARFRAVTLDKDKRNELMIIYLEDISLTEQKGMQSTGDDPKASAELQNKMEERFRSKLKVSR